MRSFISDFFHLIYPDICLGCSRSLIKNEHILCSHCVLQFPKTAFEFDDKNSVFELFKGRISLETAYALAYFTKGEILQSLLHQLKYKGKKEIGVYLGELSAKDFVNQKNTPSIDLIIPVPIHAKKLKIRGYNQSEMIVRGFSNIAKIPTDTQSLVRKTASDSQTKKKRWNRWENVQEVFHVQHPENIAHKHVLLVDDVITTGATLESCAQELLKVEGCRVSIAGVAFAGH